MRKIYLILLAVLSGLLLTLSWPAKGFPFLIFLSFLPLIYIEDYIGKNRHNFSKAGFFLISYITFFIWNLCTTWWIVYSTLFGAVMAIVINALFMAIVMHLYHMVRRTLFRSRGGFFMLPLFWITFEFLHLNWDLTWSWLNIGNVFANYPIFIQWYDITGTFGGAVWILVINILLYKLLLFSFGNIRSAKLVIAYSLGIFLILILPVTASLIRYYTYTEKGNGVNIVVVQPNIDPYNEKFGENALTEQQQLDKILYLARLKIDDNTDFLVCPETSLPEGIIEDELDDSQSIDSLKALIHDFPKLQIVIGISSYKIFSNGEEKSATARYSKGGGYWFDACNTGMYLDSTFKAQLYHKSKLVPGVEKMPFPRLLKPLQNLAIDMGGMTGSYGIQEERTALGQEEGVKVGTAICYESIYGDFVTGYVRNGANILCIITNDGWWKNSPGHRQHMQYARLRAIETRRSIARSGNTGISCFINQRGDVFQQTNYGDDDVINQSINTNDRITLYVRFGDYIGRVAMYSTFLILIAHIGMMLLNRRKRIKVKKSGTANRL